MYAQYMIGSTVKFESDHSVYAVWSANTLNVTFSAVGGTCGTAEKSVVFGGTYGALPQATREGYAFLGWFTQETGGEQVLADTAVEATQDHTLYAHWRDLLRPDTSSGLTLDPDERLLSGTPLLTMTAAQLAASFENDASLVHVASGSASGLTTGAVVTLTDAQGVIQDQVTVVLYGDVDGDGRFDGRDAVLINALTQRLLTKETLGAASYAAADANRDGAADLADINLLRAAGLSLAPVAQE